MSELIDELQAHKSKNNTSVCEELIEIIKEHKINSKEELLAYENEYFYALYF